MAKISPVSIKYMIHASFTAEGALEKPDVIGALFGQTEGLLGADLEMRELQKEGKIGRIEVDLERQGKMTVGKIHIPTALDQSETTLIGAAIETIERMGPCDSQIEIERIEDVRGSKRDYILERAKKLMQSIEGSSESREISKQVKESRRIDSIQKYGEEELPCGDLSGNEIIVVEGRADVINLLKAGVNNVVGMNGTKLPDSIKKLGKEKQLILFVDGDRGGKLIIQNVLDNAEVRDIAIAPDGKEVEELAGKEILMCLRKTIPVKEYLRKGYFPKEEKAESLEETVSEKIELTDEKKEKLKEIFKDNLGKEKALLLDSELNEIKSISIKSFGATLEKIKDKPKIIIIDGVVTKNILLNAEGSGCQILVANNFAATSEKIKLLSF
ncbi:MAG: DNA primase DnaG [Nanoarchaeota archaeon]|nr:DNA primase DnaG [Nanoarchaeota archaeon]